MEMFLWAVVIITINAVISTAIIATAFKKMYSVYYDRTMDIYKKMEKLADAGIKK